MQDMYTLLMHGDIPICLPGSVQRMSTYVILEQEDWFEDEIAFVRRLVLPGMKVVDIGANYGVYTLAMARLVGPEGVVWAFEPASATMSHLRASMEKNNMSHVQLVQKAVSNRNGTSYLSLRADTELNTLSGSSDASEQREAVGLVTLDDCAKEYDWSGLEFIKLDAEGEEHNIVTGGKSILARESPLIMFELKRGETPNLALINQFAELGYETYRLVPGLNLLVPFRRGDQPDPFQLNLFCCKPDRAALLEARGLLMRARVNEDDGAQDITGRLVEVSDDSFPVPALIGRWAENGPHSMSAGSTRHHDALRLYGLAHRLPVREASARYSCLLAAYQKAKSADSSLSSPARMQTRSRIAWELGLRSESVQMLGLLLRLLETGQCMDMDEPFLVVAPRFESLDPGRDLTRWCLAALLEQQEILLAYSSYFMSPKALQRIERMRSLGFFSAQMERRRQLIGIRHGIQAQPEPHPLLMEKSPENLNPAFWAGAQTSNRET